MVAHVPGERMRLPLVPLAAVTFGGVCALFAAAVPASVLDALSPDGGFAAWLPLAQNGRPLFALATGAIGSGAGAVAALLVSPRRETVTPPVADAEERMPLIRRAEPALDSHLEAPLRTGHAADVAAAAATPGIEIAERDLPADLDQPLAAFDPLAIPAMPLPPPVPPRRQRMAYAGERAPGTAVDATDRLVRPETDASVHALLERLERGVVRRGQAAQARSKARPERSLDDALATLRNLARQA